MLCVTPLPAQRAPAFKDNYIFVLYDDVDRHAVVIDPGDATAVEEYLAAENLTLKEIYLTHHHPDHVGGVKQLQQATGCAVIGFEEDAYRLPMLDRVVQAGETIAILGYEVEVMFIPGHTLTHIAYHFTQEHKLFCGDTLFLMGCGRLFEGTALQMFKSLAQIKALSDQTLIYCAHEYTLANAQFATTVEPGNKPLQQRFEEVKRLRADGRPTVPGILAEEKETNPFLRTHSSEIQRNLGMTGENELLIFAELRKLKDTF